MAACPNAKLVIEMVDSKSETVRWIAARCKKWSCPVCARINALNLGRLIGESLMAYIEERRQKNMAHKYELKLVTLTVPGEKWREENTRDEAARKIKKALKSLLEWLRREADLEEYVWVCEDQQDGWPHIHLVILGRGIAGKWIMRAINDRWCELGMGRSEVALVRKPIGVNVYLAKYLGKGEQKEDTKGMRAWSMSKKLRKRVKEKRELASERYTVVRIYARNSDGSRGKLIWEKGSGISLESALAAANLDECLDYFERKKNGGGQEQITFLDD